MKTKRASTKKTSAKHAEAQAAGVKIIDAVHAENSSHSRAERTKATGAAHVGTGRARKTGATRVLLPLLIFCLGIGVCLYPYIAQQINNQSATRVVESFFATADDTYNGVAEGATYTYDETVENVFGSIFIPKLNLELPIYLGSTPDNLARGIAHLEGTSLPTGGQSTHAVLAGHSGAVTNEWFTHIDQMARGDMFYIRNLEETLTYRVISMEIISPTDTSKLYIRSNEDLVTLLTCTQSGAMRLIVTGERAL